MSEEFLELNIDMLPFRFNRKWLWWFRDKEIDIVALNDNTREILFLECKWSFLNQNDVEHILKLLKEKKSGYLKWNNDNRIEHFGVTAKKIQDKKMFIAQDFVAFDLDDFYVEENI